MSQNFRILGFNEMSPEEACEFLAQAGAHLKRLYKRIAGLEARAEKAEAAIELCMVGGNHLANLLIEKAGADFAEKWPPDTDPQEALRTLCATDRYDIWCCWSAIMRARAALREQEHGIAVGAHEASLIARNALTSKGEDSNG